MFKKSNFLNANNELNDAAVIEMLSPVLGNSKEKAEQVIKECKPKEPANKEDVPLAMFKCFGEAKANANM